jgi:hypothetical protein
VRRTWAGLRGREPPSTIHAVVAPQNRRRLLELVGGRRIEQWNVWTVVWVITAPWQTG